MPARTDMTRELVMFFMNTMRNKTTEEHLVGIIRDIFGVKNFSKDLRYCLRNRNRLYPQDISMILRGVPIETLYSIFVDETRLKDVMIELLQLRLNLSFCKEDIDKKKRKHRDIPKSERINFSKMQKIYKDSCKEFTRILNLPVFANNEFILNKNYWKQFRGLKEKLDDLDYRERDFYGDFADLDSNYDYEDDYYPRPPQTMSPRRSSSTNIWGQSNDDPYEALASIPIYDDRNPSVGGSSNLSVNDQIYQLNQKLDSFLNMQAGNIGYNIPSGQQVRPDPRNISVRYDDPMEQKQMQMPSTLDSSPALNAILGQLNLITAQLSEQRNIIDELAEEVYRDDEDDVTFDPSYSPRRMDPEANMITEQMQSLLFDDDVSTNKVVAVQQDTSTTTTTDNAPASVQQEEAASTDPSTYTNAELVDALNKAKGSDRPKRATKTKTATVEKTAT